MPISGNDHPVTGVIGMSYPLSLFDVEVEHRYTT